MVEGKAISSTLLPPRIYQLLLSAELLVGTHHHQRPNNNSETYRKSLKWQMNKLLNF